jgi:ABC-2 type transport system ATP-binding protein
VEKNVLEVHNLVKNYGSFRAVDGISFNVPKGKIIGLLGPNGAGKTTTIHMLLGITLLSSGKIMYFEKDFTKHREYCLQKINFTSSFNTLQGRISVWENLLVFAGLYQLKNPEKKIHELLQYFEVEDLIDQKYWDLSAGQRSRVNIIKSLLNDPELILMDEPTASLDPDIADKMLTLIEDMRKTKGISVLYTSHDMNEVTRICDEVIFLSHGKIVAQDTPHNLTKRIPNAYVILQFDSTKNLLHQYLQEKQYKHDFVDNSTVRVLVEEKDIPKLIFGISKTGVYITNIELKKADLEDVFLQIARGGNNGT